MYPTLHHKDIMFIQRAFYTPRAGDVVVLRKDGFPSEGESEAIVKRVIATAGQEVHIDFDTNTLYVDGVALDEPYINPSTDWPDPSTGIMESHEWLEGDNFVPDDGMLYTDLIVPEGSIFVMGDNRNGSTDSRDYRLGPVDERYVLGRAVCVFFPFNRIGSIQNQR
jgi:signal peptidase I